MRFARTCYDHLAGQLGVEITAALAERAALITTDGVDGTGRRPGDRLSAALAEHPYALGPAAPEVFASLGLDPAAVEANRGRRPMLKFCLDWSEQRHHLAGALGAALADRFLTQGWVARRRPGHRALRITDTGTDALATRLGVRLTL